MPIQPDVPRTIARAAVCAAFAIILALAAEPVAAQQEPGESEAEARARMQRRGAGMHVGFWSVRGLREVSGAEYSATPLFEGYFQRGLDRHLAMQSSVSIWRRSQELESEGGIIGSGTRETVDSWVVPMFTALRFFPFTTPAQRLEPYVEGGVGLALGIDDRETTAGGGLGFGAQSGISTVVGFGLKGGLGFEWRFSRPLGLAAGGRYQWVRFTEDLGGERIYRGFGAELGLTYRFQFD
ncbi:MAG TPA: hypothetical protein VMM18_09655 [Gemmatimonadaceae bacterium]|nr:hypothetical protein [Gemmatimonadaceae bacterium]